MPVNCLMIAVLFLTVFCLLAPAEKVFSVYTGGLNPVFPGGIRESGRWKRMQPAHIFGEKYKRICVDKGRPCRYSVYRKAGGTVIL